MAVVTLYSVLLLYDAPPGAFSYGVGISAAILLGLMYLCAFATVVVVVKARVLFFTPLWLSLTVGCNSISWTIYGLYGGFMSILVPDVVGIILFLALAIAYASTRARHQQKALRSFQLGPKSMAPMRRQRSEMNDAWRVHRDPGASTQQQQPNDDAWNKHRRRDSVDEAATDRLLATVQTKFGSMSPFGFPEMLKMSSIMFASDNRSLPSMSTAVEEMTEDAGAGSSLSTKVVAAYGAISREHSRSCPYIHVKSKGSLNSQSSASGSDAGAESAERLMTL